MLTPALPFFRDIFLPFVSISSAACVWWASPVKPAYFRGAPKESRAFKFSMLLLPGRAVRGCTKSISHHLRNPGLIGFSCKHLTFNRFLSTMMQLISWCEFWRKGHLKPPHAEAAPRATRPQRPRARGPARPVRSFGQRSCTQTLRCHGTAWAVAASCERQQAASRLLWFGTWGSGDRPGGVLPVFNLLNFCFGASNQKKVPSLFVSNFSTLFGASNQKKVPSVFPTSQLVWGKSSFPLTRNQHKQGVPFFPVAAGHLRGEREPWTFEGAFPRVFPRQFRAVPLASN